MADPSTGLGDNYAKRAEDDNADPKEREASMLFSIAEEAIRDNVAPDDALRAAMDALAVFRELGVGKSVADTARLVVNAHKAKADKARYDTSDGDNKKVTESLRTGERVAKQELENFRKEGDARGQATMLIAIAELSGDKRGSAKREEARKAATEAQELAQEAGDTRLEATALIALTHVLIKQAGKSQDHLLIYDQEQEAINKALELARADDDDRAEAKALHALGCSHNCHKFYDLGYAALRESLQCWRQVDCKPMIALELFSIAECWLWRQDPEKAIESAREALEMYRDLCQDRRFAGKQNEAAVLDIIVRAHIMKGESEEALRLAQEGVKRYKEKGEKKGEGFACSLVMQSYIAQDATQEVLSTAKDVLSIHRKLGNKDALASTYEALAKVHQKGYNYNEAMECARRAVGIYTEKNDKKGVAQALHTNYEILMSEGKFTEAMEIAETVLDQYRAVQHHAGEGLALLYMANIHLWQEELEDAKNLCLDAQVCSQRGKDPSIEAGSLHLLCEVHTKEKDFSAATNAAKKARFLLRDLSDKAREVEMLLLVSKSELSLAKHNREPQNRTPLYSSRGFDKALAASKEAVSIARKMGRGDLCANSLHQEAKVYIAAQRTQLVMPTLEEGLSVCRDTKNRATEADMLVTVAELHIERKDRQEAVKAANEAADIFMELGDNGGYERAMNVLGVYQQPQAYAYRPPEPSEVIDAPAASQAQQVVARPAVPKIDDIKRDIQKLSADLTADATEILVDVPLMDAGIDSLAMVDLRNQLTDKFPGVTMSNTFLFDYPTIGELSTYISDTLTK